MFVAVSDHVLGNLDAGWRNRNINWTMDNIHLTSTAYADDMCLLASSIKDLELKVKECIAGFLAAGLGNGFGQNLLDQHDTLTERHFERLWTHDPLGRENHTCRCEDPRLQQQRLSHDKQATKSHGCVREMIKHNWR